jgi:hypothetical protein
MTENKPLVGYEKELVELIGKDTLYSVAYIEDFKDRKDNVFTNAPVALSAMGVHGFLDCIKCIAKKELILLNKEDIHNVKDLGMFIHGFLTKAMTLHKEPADCEISYKNWKVTIKVTKPKSDPREKDQMKLTENS